MGCNIERETGKYLIKIVKIHFIADAKNPIFKLKTGIWNWNSATNKVPCIPTERNGAANLRLIYPAYLSEVN